jgi:hypothetical protein
MLPRAGETTGEKASRGTALCCPQVHLRAGLEWIRSRRWPVVQLAGCCIVNAHTALWAPTRHNAHQQGLAPDSGTVALRVSLLRLVRARRIGLRASPAPGKGTHGSGSVDCPRCLLLRIEEPEKHSFPGRGPRGLTPARRSQPLPSSRGDPKTFNASRGS